ncbi:dimethyl sulfoxide reductase subunit A (plasmid) [Rhodovastum atsumiense]|uniref:Molybdopterin-dependent oxidoreductase n=1 Tax=Rhodovastum atsumiense TaxID=504468 RepID=A0A5M6IIW4_9PROT|nr:DMSO/selenate family reductase complex A subunit [Rhodovastum atsumiense]KAA5608062.1 molybdopterin-dependent oxidoreductase [Rhodovastum atsumiense]CAH2605664.1 dimethyl sulfoxide reductase subunit A [Rhodovastum atsumiense]
MGNPNPRDPRAVLTRRSFVAGSALAAVPFVAGTYVSDASAQATTPPLPAGGERVVQTCSTFDCGGKCDIRAHVKDGVVTRISTRPDADLDEHMPIMRACVRGRGYRRFVYNADRLKYPMKRVGRRGEGRFERITWDEATTLIAAQMKRIGETYGPGARFVHNNTAVSGGAFSGHTMVKRLLNLTGGHLEYYHSVSMGNTAAITPYTYGTAATGNSLDTLLDSKLIILWGHNPTETIFGHLNHYLQRAKDKGIRIVVVDPRYSDTVAAYADEWVPLLPTTDNALMDAMAYVIVSEGLQDQKFLDTYCIGFDEVHMPEGVPPGESWKSYLLGEKDGTPKTPDWAERITRVPAATIRHLAREYAVAKPAALIQGWGPQRHVCGERTARGGSVLPALTGNVGIRGGWACGYGGIGNRKFPASPDMLANPVKGKINITTWTEAVEDASQITPTTGLRGAEKLDADIRMIFCLAGNYMANQNPDINATVKLLEDERKVEFIVCSDLYFTPSARYADVLLPETSFMERWNLGATWGSGNYFVLSEKLVEPPFECRSDYEWLAEVARKLGVEQAFTLGRSEKDWIAALVEDTRKAMPSEGVPTFEELLVRRVHKFAGSESYVAFEKQIRDPENNKFSTPSGKIEIFSKRLYDMKNPAIPAVPRYVPSPEGPSDPLAARYPLQFITWKGKNRANSTMFVSPWMKQVQQQRLWINPLDAEPRGIHQGDPVRVFNDRGITVVPAEVTPRIIPGVVALQSAAWWAPDRDGIDRGGCANVLTSRRRTPLNGNSHQTNLVEVRKA